MLELLAVLALLVVLDLLDVLSTLPTLDPRTLRVDTAAPFSPLGNNPPRIIGTIPLRVDAGLVDAGSVDTAPWPSSGNGAYLPLCEAVWPDVVPPAPAALDDALASPGGPGSGTYFLLFNASKRLFITSSGILLSAALTTVFSLLYASNSSGSCAADPTDSSGWVCFAFLLALARYRRSAYQPVGESFAVSVNSTISESAALP